MVRGGMLAAWCKKNPYVSELAHPSPGPAGPQLKIRAPEAMHGWWEWESIPDLPHNQLLALLGDNATF